jgi:DNA-sulfur modification-associated
MIKDRSELQTALSNVLEEQVKPKKKLSTEIKDELSKYGILHGDSQRWIGSSKEELPNLDSRELYLLTESTYNVTKVHDIFPRHYFTEHEQKEAYQYDASLDRETKKFPITYQNAMVMGNRKWLVLLSSKEIKELLDNGLLYYNFDTQRESNVTRLRDKVIIEPTVNKKNIEEMTQLMLDGKFESTNIIFNAAPRTSSSGNEVIFNDKNKTLTLTEGTRLDNVDGYHRSMAIQNALEINPNIDILFPVIFTNYATKQAQNYLYQISQATPVSKEHVDSLVKTDHSLSVIQELKSSSELKIAPIHQRETLNDEMVTFSNLKASLQNEFGSKMKNRNDELDVAEYLEDFFKVIFATYEDDFINNPIQSREYSIINNDFVISYGLIILARRMFELEIKPREIRKILKNIDFSKSNETWINAGILTSDGIINGNSKQLIKSLRKYFEEIEIQ